MIKSDKCSTNIFNVPQNNVAFVISSFPTRKCQKPAYNCVQAASNDMCLLRDAVEPSRRGSNYVVKGESPMQVGCPLKHKGIRFPRLSYEITTMPTDAWTFLPPLIVRCPRSIFFSNFSATSAPFDHALEQRLLFFSFSSFFTPDCSQL